jgi:hypothetical protein
MEKLLMSNTPEPVIVPTNPADLAKIKAAIQEVSNVMTMIEAKRDFIGDEVKNISETYDIPTKYVRKMVKVFHKQTFHREMEEMSDFESLYYAVTGEKAA